MALRKFARGFKGQFTPFALIVRVDANETPDKPSKSTSYLAVAKISPEKTCVVGKIPPQKNQNFLARELADKSLNKPCLR